MLASRGAKLIEELRIQEMNRSIEEERTNLDNLRAKMENIKKISNLINQEKRKRIRSHDLAIRTGDIYMFADDFEDDDYGDIPPVVIMKRSSVRMSGESVSAENFEIESQATVSSVDMILEHSKRLKKFCATFLQKWFLKIHEQSKQHTYIIKLLSQEKKYLREAMANLSSSENDNLGEKLHVENYQNIFAKAATEVAKQMRFDL